MAYFLMKIQIHVEREVLIEASDSDSAQDIAQDVWVDEMGSLNYTVTPIEKVN